MISFPNAKINIGLNITEKRTDGFHNIETIFYPISLSDILEINKSEDNLKYINTGLTIENGKLESNLCYKAYQLLKKDFSLPEINIHLHKIIPFGSGLGGGSSDASFTLKSLNNLFDLNLSKSELLKFSEQIGSDCPVFIENLPAYAAGKGNILKPVEINLKEYFLVIVHPGIHVNTGVAYSQSKPKKPEKSLLELIKNPLSDWKKSIHNDFENIIFPLYPEIKQIKEKLYELGAIYASMSGSGSSVYGIFKNDIELKNYFNSYFIWKEEL